MEGVLALMIPIVAVGGFFAWMLALSPVGRAYAEKLRGGSRKGATGEAEGNAELLESVEQLRREVAELAERVDFTERLLGQQRGGERLGPPRA
jgi:hypothetical protein